MYKVGDMKLLRYILFMSTFAVACMSCHEQEEFDNDPYGNFDALWTNVDQHYCFFKYKNIDWEAVGGNIVRSYVLICLRLHFLMFVLRC